MTQSVYEILPWIAAAMFGAAGLTVASPAGQARGSWMVPALFSAVFLAWSLWTIAQQGVSAVWVEHTRNAWGNQIWFDLLMAAGLSFALTAPRARTVGMRPLPWFVLIAATGSIGLFAMMARVLFLESRPATPAGA